jgi:hypothetical protein
LHKMPFLYLMVNYQRVKNHPNMASKRLLLINAAKRS